MTLTDSDVSERPVDVRPILLPQAGDGQRRRRRYERKRVMRQRWMAGGAVVVAALAAVLLLRGTHTGKQRVTTTQPPAAVGNQSAGPATAPAPGVAPPSVLVQHVSNGHTSSITAFLPAAEGGGTVLVFPANTTLKAVAANLPRQKADTVLTVDNGQLTQLFQHAGPLVVNVAGHSSTVSPEQAPAFFSSKDAAEAIAHERAYWDAWLTRVSGETGALPTQAALAQAVASIAKGTWTVAVPPGTVGG